MHTHNEDQDVIYASSAYNPFPEPQTIPSGWDTSEFFTMSQIDSDVNEDDSTESPIQ